MATVCPYLFDVLPLLRRLPIGTYFNVGPYSPLVELQAADQAAMSAIKECLPNVVWKRIFCKDYKWWEYSCTFEGIPIRVYGCYEAPASCTPIIEKHMVKREVPTAFEMREVEESVIVGWDCGNGRRETRSED